MSKTMDVKKHAPGSVPQFYPMNQVSKVLVNQLESRQSATAGTENQRKTGDAAHAASKPVKAVHRDVDGNARLDRQQEAAAGD